MVYIERRGVHEVEHWSCNAQLRDYYLIIYEMPPKVTVRRESSAPPSGHIYILSNPTELTYSTDEP